MDDGRFQCRRDLEEEISRMSGANGWAEDRATHEAIVEAIADAVNDARRDASLEWGWDWSQAFENLGLCDDDWADNGLRIARDAGIDC